MPEDAFNSVVPAQLSYLTIYNPLLGPTDETIPDQIVFYTSRAARLRRREASAAGVDDNESSSEYNEKLRQIGLAQGMVSFARNFSQGKPVEYIETEKANIVLHELEKDWWILASIDLTRLPTTDASNESSSQRDATGTPSVQYSSREMCPPHLLIQQLRRAHSIFLLHHDLTLDALYQRVGRSALCTLLDGFWRKFAWNWEVLLSGNPAVDMYNGIKLSAGGELGIGVGEEEWGSGEREVFEDFVFRTDGLVDLVISRFGDPAEPNESQATAKDDSSAPWLGLDTHPRPSDGVIFSGMGAVSRRSVARVSQWMEWIYRYGPDAYGVGDDPSSPRRRKRRKKPRNRSARNNNEQDNPSGTASAEASFSPGIPRPLVMGQVPGPQQRDSEVGSQASSEGSPAPSERGKDWIGIKPETFVKYLTLGYGSAWGPSAGTHPRVEALKQEDGSTGATQRTASPATTPQTPDGDTSRTEDTAKPQNLGRFLIGLHKNPATANSQSPEDPSLANKSPVGSEETIIQRTLNVHMADADADANADGQHQSPTKLRVVVYIHQPFVYTFLFHPEAPSLADPSLYQSIHHQLRPLHKTLANSTSPANAAARISMSESAFDVNRRFIAKSQPVYDLVYDPSNLTIRTSIPNIPDLGVYAPETRDPSAAPWSRVESLNIHHRLLSTYVETRQRALELERTCKTSRGWWVVWVRFPHPCSDGDGDSDDAQEAQSIEGRGDTRQEAFLIRKASDHVPAASHGRSGSGSRFFRDLGGATSPGLASSRADTGPGKLVEGLGLDARRYIENLLSLNR
ncbi:hypothetical protein P170DRAFT_438639 [Aspergillus steynii IBT 23096]|uniref:CCZ1/INTU/HSP4 first Longin domain-containing protein n=1 Tax=Aspergillus steynii IBT 23096 TaxID=1392250 RepID=A0A2I2G224_9EURO|nr:uncharacterized protein P170DRAFT_438639 [Aspergillus steynii IBT 23096]PLB46940.1 hypothetical protein P170DRAFT_438639 [Aspergillus steynii IBT 23096]